jgi:CHAT domain-containing protein
MPFEVLRDENSRYLLEKFSIQYQFSTSLLLNVGYPSKAVGVLAFAPFSDNEFQSENFSFDKLPASQTEVSDLNGKIFTDSTATKSNFFLTANRYDIIHLATHANIDNEKPLESYIAFYPLSDQNNEYLLYARNNIMEFNRKECTCHKKEEDVSSYASGIASVIQ